MKTALFLLGVVTGLALTRIPHYTRGMWVSNEPATPANHKPRIRHWNGGVEV